MFSLLFTRASVLSAYAPSVLYLLLVERVEGVEEMLSMLVVRLFGVFLGRDLLHRAFLQRLLHSTVFPLNPLLRHSVHGKAGKEIFNYQGP